MQGAGDIPQTKMLLKLLSLGEPGSQVQVYSLQQVVGYSSPPFRFKDEAKDPIILRRGSSDTVLDKTKDLEEKRKFRSQKRSSTD